MQGQQNNNDDADAIAANLRKAFNERAEEDVPQRFLDLLNELRDQEGETAEEEVSNEQ